MILDHVSLGVTDMPRAMAFYAAALAPLGIVAVKPVAFGDITVAVGYGAPDGHPEFWVGLPWDQHPATSGNGAHFCFRAADRAAVDAFYAAALAHGGRDDGPPGLRTMYHPDYYAAFVRDPDGNKIEAVCHAPA